MNKLEKGDSPSKTAPPSTMSIAAGFALIYVVWGSTYLAIRVAVETLPPFLMASGRFLISGLMLAIGIAVARGFRPTLRQCRDNAVIGGFLLLGGNGLVSWAERDIPSGIATLIVSISPLFVVLLDWGSVWFFQDGQRGTRPTVLTFVGLALGFLGLVILVGPSLLKEDATHLTWFHVALLLVACLSWSLGSLMTRYVREQAEPFTACALQMLFGGGWLLGVSLLRGELGTFDYRQVSANSWLAWIYLILVGSLMGFTTFVWLMKHSSPTRVSTYAYVNPIVAVFLGWWILNEPVDSRIFLAAAVIILGVALITIAKNRKH